MNTWKFEIMDKDIGINPDINIDININIHMKKKYDH